jgi:hypothetical protein
MNSRPLLDYLVFPNDHADTAPPAQASARSPEVADPPHGDSLEARLEALAARLRAKAPAAPVPAPAPVSVPEQDLTLSSQIEAILRRKSPQPAEHRAPQAPREVAERQVRRERLVIDPPPSVPTFAAPPSVDPEFAKFSEAVHLIGQAARRFVEQPPVAVSPAQQPAPLAPSTAEIDALSAVLRETVSAFRSVADDLAVSAGEIRNVATRSEQVQNARRDAVRERDEDLRDTVTAFQVIARELAASVGEIRAATRHDERQPAARRDRRDRYRDEEDEIHDLRDTMTDLQDRLDTLLHARRRARY